MNRLGSGIAVGLVALGAVFALGAATPAADDDPSCRGRIPTIIGSDDADRLQGTEGRDVIFAGDGDDEIHASLGNDLVCGGPGADLVRGGRGNDTVDGGAGSGDRVIGDLGDDHLMGGPGEHDEVAGSLGIDTISGGAGSFDLIHGDYGYDRMDGGPGQGDVASFATKVAGGKGDGVWASLKQHRSRGDGHDRLFRFEDLEGSAFRDTLIGSKAVNTIDGGPGDDTLIGAGGPDVLRGGQGTDGCKGAKGRTVSCGKERALKASAYIEIHRPPGHPGGGLTIVGGGGRDDIVVAFDETSSTFGISAGEGMAIGPGCERVTATQVSCAANPARWVMADLGPGRDSLRVDGSLEGAQNVRFAGGYGNDTIHAGPEDDLVEAGPGADRLYGGDGADGLIGGLPGPTFLYGEGNGDLLAAGGGCAGGAIVGGDGRDDASFAETQAHPGILIISFPQNKAWVDVLMDNGCRPVRLDDSDEDMEGSFDYDVLIGDSGPNALLGQPGRDELYGNGGDDIIDARDGVRDFVVQCGRGTYVYPPRKPKGPPPEPILRGTPTGRALTDSFDPPVDLCADHVFGAPVKGLNNSG